MDAESESYRLKKMIVFGRHVKSMFNFFFFYDTATPDIYTLSLHDALPIFRPGLEASGRAGDRRVQEGRQGARPGARRRRRERSEEHTSELQSLAYLVCRLLLEKKKSVVMIPCDGRCNSSQIGQAA